LKRPDDRVQEIEMNRMSKAVVTGGCGFIGSHIVDRLLKDGLEVTVIDNFATGHPENLVHQSDNKNLQIIEDDICNHERMFKACKDSKWVFHLAALADIVPSIQRPLDYHHSNVNGTASVLEAARAANVEKFIYAASSTCYGIPEQYPTAEDASIATMYPYALTKNVGEEYAMQWNKTYDLPVNCLRMFNVYGPRSRTSGTYGAVFGVFLAQKLAGKEYTIVGDGEQTRDFTYISDIVEAFIAAASSDVVGEVMNVGSGNTYSINRLVELLGGNTTHIPKRPGEPDCTFADISKIRRLLNWEPQISLEKGVELMLENIDYWKSAPVWTPEAIEVETKEWFQYLK
jgi:UDP-glucose 4-epimerase